mmetsp:Transcript_14262/g.11474  ORF Transcript_14262/g.11474 Transcript_14262/m.11474 type:complete len:125 (-) Transcript_14262:130-504(-)
MATDAVNDTLRNGMKVFFFFFFFRRDQGNGLSDFQRVHALVGAPTLDSPSERQLVRALAGVPMLDRLATELQLVHALASAPMHGRPAMDHYETSPRDSMGSVIQPAAAARAKTAWAKTVWAKTA